MYDQALFMRTLAEFTRHLLTPHDTEQALTNLACHITEILGLVGLGLAWSGAASWGESVQAVVLSGRLLVRVQPGSHRTPPDAKTGQAGCLVSGPGRDISSFTLLLSLFLCPDFASQFAPHPNPRKAAEGFQLKKLVLDEPAATVVRRIFDKWLAGESLREIVHHLNTDGIDCPSARDRVRNPHRAADGWQARTIATILENPRYTGYEAWGKFRKVEMLVDPDDPSWGHLTRLRRSSEPVIRSREQAHEAIVTVEEWVRVQAIRERKAVVGLKGERSRRSSAAYALKGMIHCASCTRKMGAERYNTKVDDPQRPRYVRYRCRSRDLVPGSA